MIRGVIFDLGGTIVDRYSLSPLINLRRSLVKSKVNLPSNLIARDMGMDKFDHITHLSYETEFRDQFLNNNGRPHTHVDLQDIYKEFCVMQEYYLKHELDIIPETCEAIRYLQERDIKVGITTGFNKSQMDLCLENLAENNIIPDSAVSSSCLDVASRPDPQMIQENMRRMGIDNPKHVLKVDDTCVGIEEGHNAECITVGVARWSINMGIDSIEAKHRLDYEKYYGELEHDEFKSEFKRRLYECRQKLHKAEPCYLINTLNDLKNCLF